MHPRLALLGRDPLTTSFFYWQTHTKLTWAQRLNQLKNLTAQQLQPHTNLEPLSSTAGQKGVRSIMESNFPRTNVLLPISSFKVSLDAAVYVFSSMSSNKTCSRAERTRTTMEKIEAEGNQAGRHVFGNHIDKTTNDMNIYQF